MCNGTNGLKGMYHFWFRHPVQIVLMGKTDHVQTAKANFCHYNILDVVDNVWWVDWLKTNSYHQWKWKETSVRHPFQILVLEILPNP